MAFSSSQTDDGSFASLSFLPLVFRAGKNNLPSFRWSRSDMHRSINRHPVSPFTVKNRTGRRHPPKRSFNQSKKCLTSSSERTRTASLSTLGGSTPDHGFETHILSWKV